MSSKFAVFDIDGTLIRWQLYHALTDKLAKAGLLGENAKQQLNEARMKWKRRENSEQFKEYESALIALYEAGIQKVAPEDFDDFVQTVITEYKDQVYTYTRELVSQLKEGGYTLLAISGSHQELVEQIATYYQFDDWVGTRYERSDSGFTGKKFVASFDKKAVLQKLIKKHQLSIEGSYAIGDSASDGLMLELVEHPIAFNPDQALFTLAQKNGWKVVIERKNMIYELEQQNGTYYLAKTN